MKNTPDHKVLFMFLILSYFVVLHATALTLTNLTFAKDCQQLKPIFHRDSKLLALGKFALHNAKDSTFALPNAKNTSMLVSLALGDANFLRWPCTFHFLCVDFIHVG